MHDFIPLSGQRRLEDKRLQLVTSEYKMYHSVLMNSKSKIDFDRLRNLHMLDMAEESEDTSWECSRMLEYYEDRGGNEGHHLNCLVEWRNINKTQSCVNFFALSLNNPTPIISFARSNNLLPKMPFCHLVQYCMSKTELEKARVYKSIATPIITKYKFGIQVPKGIKNAINLDMKNGNSLWQEAIKTELKQLKDYQTFIVLDSGENIPKGYQKIPYHIEFDVKYDLRHKARLVAGGNWTVNEKEDIYSGVVRMDTVRIGFFLGELYGLSCCACDIGNAFLYEKTKEQVYITAVPEFGADLCGKN